MDPTIIPKSYDAKEIEPTILRLWNELDIGEPSPKGASCCIVMPPPNVTGVLHMGHALGLTLQDTFVRWRRMMGESVLYIPGVDHAGIATQTVVERDLWQREEKSKEDLGREGFLKLVWQRKEWSEETIVRQISTMGCSCDWKRKRFTMDEQSNRAVFHAFKKLFTRGLIYRGNYLVNWDPIAKTALSDDEVEYEEREGTLFFIRYPMQGSAADCIIATTRPETMVGDVALAVHPDDERYRHWIGQRVTLPLFGRDIPIIADVRIDPTFGTGICKVTPAHDPLDYQIGRDHGLPSITMMDERGRVNELGNDFANLMMAEARQKIVAALKEGGYLQKTIPHTMRVGLSYRTKAVIEPRLSSQWFLKMSSFRAELRGYIERKEMEIIPQRFEKTYLHWIDQLNDWCISRQLWWGHRIPVWYHEGDGRMVVALEEDLPQEIKDHREEWKRDPDVLDTWFSSALWPFSTLGWPEDTADHQRFFPNALLVTGHDILFFWVARMALLSHLLEEAPPFPKVYLHGLIYGKSYWRNSPERGISYVSQEERRRYDLGEPVPKDVFFRWEKMSKSKGNVLDPFEMIEEYGCDAMRMALTTSATGMMQIDLDRRRFEEFQHFSNKIWNGARFILQQYGLEGWEEESCPIDPSLEERWIVSRLETAIQLVNEELSLFRFDKAALLAYTFYWDDLCSYFLEISKPLLFKGEAAPRRSRRSLLFLLLLRAIRLLHPFAPFITEKLFQMMRLQTIHPIGIASLMEEGRQALLATSIAHSPYPNHFLTLIDPSTEAEFAKVQEIIYAIRKLRGELKIPPQQPSDLIFEATSEIMRRWLLQREPLIRALSQLSSYSVVDECRVTKGSATVRLEGCNLFVLLPIELLERERHRLIKEKERIHQELLRLQRLRLDPDFQSKASADAVAKVAQNYAKREEELAHIEEKLITFIL